MTGRGLHIAWGMLMLLSLGSTLLSWPEIWAYWPVAGGVGALLLAWLKARIVLSRYLGLQAAPFWLRGFEISLALLVLLLLALYILPFAFG